MIGVLDIERSLSDGLKQEGYLVVASESLEGSKAPYFGIHAFPTSAERFNDAVVVDTFGVELSYYPGTETREELIQMADKLRLFLLRNPLEVQGRTLSCYRVEFSAEKGVLFADFEYQLHQQYPDAEDESLPFDELDFDFI